MTRSARRIFAFGDTLERRQANFGGEPLTDGRRAHAGRATPVGSYPPNRWGLHDMHGNVYEWCRDWYHTQLPGGVDPDLSDVKGVQNRDGTHSRARRGGAWNDDWRFLRSGARLRYEPERNSDHIGFRCVLVERLVAGFRSMRCTVVYSRVLQSLSQFSGRCRHCERSTMRSPRSLLRPAVTLAIVLLAAATATSAREEREEREEEWSRFRGPNGAGIVADAGYPTEFGPGRNLKWRSGVRPGKSSPVLSRRHVFLTAFDQGALYTQCFDRETGRLVWERSEAPARREDAHVLNEPSAATPVTDGENVYVFFRDLGVVSYDAKGKLRWKKAMGPFANRFGAVASPIIAGSSLVLVQDQFERSTLVALSLATGAVQWQASREELEAWATPVVYAPHGQPAQIVTAGGGVFGGHAVENGTRVWTHAGMAPVMVASPVVTGDTVVGFGYGYDSGPSFADGLKRSDRDGDGRISIAEIGDNAMQLGIARFYGNRDGFIVEAEWVAGYAQMVAPSSLVALSLSRDASGRTTARELWRYAKSFVAVVPSPLVLDGLIYTIKNGGILTVLDAGTGEVVKMGRVGSAPASYSASPVATGGRIYFANEDGFVFVVRAGKEWELVASNELDEPIYATPALSGGRIYVRGQKSLFSFGAE